MGRVGGAHMKAGGRCGCAARAVRHESLPVFAHVARNRDSKKPRALRGAVRCCDKHVVGGLSLTDINKVLDGAALR